jgi:putative transposase
MPRPARLVLPGLPHHVTQRGNGRARTFFGADDYRRYLDLLRASCRKAGTAVWAWCLMPNHVHLILVPAGEDGLRATLAPLHARYAGEINRREGGCGHLWQDRFASVPMDDAHLYACLRYVELNPVRARLADRPEDWPWSSARAHLGLAGDGVTDLAATRGQVEDWRAFLDAGLDEEDREAIRAAERSGRLRLKRRPDEE